MNWRKFRKAIVGALAAGAAAATADIAAGASVGETVLATVLAVVGAFGAVYATPANERTVPPSASHLTGGR